MDVCTHLCAVVFVEHVWCESRRVNLCGHVSTLYGSVAMHAEQGVFACTVSFLFIYLFFFSSGSVALFFFID